MKSFSACPVFVPPLVPELSFVCIVFVSLKICERLSRRANLPAIRLFAYMLKKRNVLIILIVTGALLLILVVIKIFEKRIQKIEKLKPDPVAGKTDNRHHSQPKQNFYA